MSDTASCAELSWAKSSLQRNPQSSSFGSWELLDLPIHQFKRGSAASLSRTPFPLAIASAAGGLGSNSLDARYRLRQLDRETQQLETRPRFCRERRSIDCERAPGEGAPRAHFFGARGASTPGMGVARRGG